MTPDKIEPRLQACRRIAREAGALARRYFENLNTLVVETKGIQDLVSIADREVEAFIKNNIADLFPEDRCIGEESGGTKGDALWVIDPIDGTTNFLRGFPHYAVSIAFMANDVVEIGAVYDPSLDHLFSARRGAGATCNGRPLHVRPATRLEESVVMIGFSHQSALPDFTAVVLRLLDKRCEFRRFGSAALGLSHVAAGHFEAFWQMHLQAWDALAGMLIVREAGGRTNDFLEGDGLTRGNRVLASTPELYAELDAATCPEPDTGQ